MRIFYLRSRLAKNITTGICLIFRGLFFEHNPGGIGFTFHRAGTDIGQKDHLWMDSSYLQRRFHAYYNLIDCVITDYDGAVCLYTQVYGNGKRA
jgi:hypothetical protein